jgi:TetR/AcrR family transcriptional regulator, repressor of fatR-cypB operon
MREPTPDRPDRREDILEAALALFAERGFHGTAVPAVAEAAKVGAGTIYRYFASKEALVNVVYKRWKGAVAHAVITDFPLHATAREQFHAFFTRTIGFATEHPLAFKFLELHHHAPYLDEASRAMEKQILAPAIEFFERSGERQITKPIDSALLMAVVWGAIVGVVKASWEGRIKLTRVTIAQSEACCWEAIRA